MIWIMLDPDMTPERLGYIPMFLSEHDPRPAAQQFHDNYAHGGGWQPSPGFRLTDDRYLKYPGDPFLQPLAETKLRDETIIYYPYSWVVILQPNGDWEVARLD